MHVDPSGQPLPHEREALDEPRVWGLLRALARVGRSRERSGSALALWLDEAGVPREVAPELGCLVVQTDSGRFELRRPAQPLLERLLDMYVPLCLGRSRPSFVFAHLGQSLDGQIATSTGASQYVTGPENIRHLHRLRALADAVLVGAGTVERDDPQLTTRLVPGENPVRVVLDPTLRLPAERKLFRDPCAPTLVLCDERAAAGRRSLGHAEIVPLPASNGELSPATVVEALGARGLRFVFIEGGGVTVSRFLGARALDRLHVTVSPLFLGQGRPGIVLPAIAELTSALRPTVRRFALGEDVLFDCEL